MPGDTPSICRVPLAVRSVDPSPYIGSVDGSGDPVAAILRKIAKQLTTCC